MPGNDLFIRSIQLPNGTTYQLNKPFTGASSSEPGVSGLVPAPSAGDNRKFLRGDGSWGTSSTLTFTVENDTIVIS